MEKPPSQAEALSYNPEAHVTQAFKPDPRGGEVMKEDEAMQRSSYWWNIGR